MSMPSEVSKKMEYVQKVFLGIQDYFLSNRSIDLDALIAFLDSEALEFRSVAYESASMELAARDLSTGFKTSEWQAFYRRCRETIPFHIEIGLGWALAKKEIAPGPDLPPWEEVIQLMVLDGMGYFNGLFRVRKTVKNHEIPEVISEEDIAGFDQGLGRRLWYNVEGQADEVARIVHSFPVFRHPALWRGIGIACGYVGGSRETDLLRLLENAGVYKKQLQTGMILAVVSRLATHSITEDVERASRVLCSLPVDDIAVLEEVRNAGLKHLGSNEMYNAWIKQIESKFA